MPKEWAKSKLMALHRSGLIQSCWPRLSEHSTVLGP
jgi:hypothetical protein